MAAIIRLNSAVTLRNLLATVPRNVRCISTSQKKSDTATITTTEKSTEANTGEDLKYRSYRKYFKFVGCL